MKRPSKRKKILKKVSALILIRLLLSATAMAVDPPHHDDQTLQTLHEMRMRQEGEENSVVRMIQQPVAIQTNICSPVEQARQRIRELKSQQKIAGDVVVEAGHGEVAVDGNNGTVNNSVNVQVVDTNDRKCF